ncbi:hypothetical protein BJV74DRAFT_887872 [Russula compacta]|nr:hypothetical protein BJV74DRAFT_887872 [Russula compacta]
MNSEETVSVPTVSAFVPLHTPPSPISARPHIREISRRSFLPSTPRPGFLSPSPYSAFGLSPTASPAGAPNPPLIPQLETRNPYSYSFVLSS